MKNVKIIFCITFLFAIPFFSFTSFEHKQSKPKKKIRITGIVIKYDTATAKGDTIKKMVLPDSVSNKKIDLKFCIENFQVPRAIPKTLPLIRKPENPQDSIWADEKKTYDSKGRIITYYYVGSAVSAMLPKSYAFKYDQTQIYNVKKIVDDFDGSYYEFTYSKAGQIQKVDHKSTGGKLMDRLIIKVQ